MRLGQLAQNVLGTWQNRITCRRAAFMLDVEPTFIGYNLFRYSYLMYGLNPYRVLYCHCIPAGSIRRRSCLRLQCWPKLQARINHQWLVFFQSTTCTFTAYKLTLGFNEVGDFGGLPKHVATHDLVGHPFSSFIHLDYTHETGSLSTLLSSLHFTLSVFSLLTL